MRFTDLSDFFYYTAISYPLVLGKSQILLFFAIQAAITGGKDVAFAHFNRQFEKHFTQTPQIPRTTSANTACVLIKLHNGRLCCPMSFAGRPPKDGSLLPASNNHRRFSPFSRCRRLMLFSSAVIEELPPVERIHCLLDRQDSIHQISVS